MSIAHGLRQVGVELLYVGSQHGPEGDAARKAGFQFIGIPSGPIAGFSTRTAASAVKLGAGFFRAGAILRSYAPDVVVGTGGYTSFSVALAWGLRRGKLVIHEQNSVPGRTNRILSKYAAKICVTFEESIRFFPQEKTEFTGLPVRPEIVTGVEKAKARESFGLDPNVFALLVFGGSQGARRINDIVVEALSDLLQASVQVIHQSGPKNYDELVSRANNRPGYALLPYIDDMSAAYSAADMVVARSGASSIAEMTVRGLPSILIPYPYAQADHQTKNAEVLARAGAAILLDEASLSAEMLVKIVSDLARDEVSRHIMAEASRRLGKPNATEEIVRIVQETGGVGKKS